MWWQRTDFMHHAYGDGHDPTPKQINCTFSEREEDEDLELRLTKVQYGACAYKIVRDYIELLHFNGA